MWPLAYRRFVFDNQILAQALRLGYQIANYGFRRFTKG